jgi:hypothetical protein
MGEVLADTGLALEHLVQGRGDIGGARMVFEVGLDALLDLACRFEDRPAGGKGTGAIGAQRRVERHER